jgi:hypothetical protein
MPKGKKPAGSESISGYFRKIFAEKPELLRGRSNEEVLTLWAADHGGKPADARVKGNLSNVKSLLRKASRKKKRKADAVEVADGNGTKPVARKAPIRNLETLEENIDNCLTMARHLDAEHLASVIKLLRTARNQVVWAQGQ